MQPPEDSLVVLAKRLSEARRQEEEAKTERIFVEQAIVALTGFEKPEGQLKYRCTDDYGSVDLVIKQPINTSVDSAAWVKLRRTLMPKHPGRGVLVAKYSIDTKAARELQTECPSAWADISSVITRKPGKISVEIKTMLFGEGKIDPEDHKQ